MNERWIDWAKELQFIAQAGLTYGKDPYDQERYTRIRDISAEMIAYQAQMPLETVKKLFCNETGYQTPKIDTRAAVFRDGKILLVHERNGDWALPGGWCDVMESVRSNAEKEVLEEAGLSVHAERIIAVQDRNRHNTPAYAYGICKVFVLCSARFGCFRQNVETVESGYFSYGDLPCLSEDKCNREQVKMCFDAFAAGDRWVVPFD